MDIPLVACRRSDHGDAAAAQVPGRASRLDEVASSARSVAALHWNRSVRIRAAVKAGRWLSAEAAGFSWLCHCILPCHPMVVHRLLFSYDYHPLWMACGAQASHTMCRWGAAPDGKARRTIRRGASLRTMARHHLSRSYIPTGQPCRRRCGSTNGDSAALPMLCAAKAATLHQHSEAAAASCRRA